MLKTENYCITPENIRVHEMIGLDVKVYSNDENKNGLSGRVVDETKNTFVIENKGEKVIPKSEAKFEFEIGDEKVMVDGKEIIYRPEQRIKALRRKMNE